MTGYVFMSYSRRDAYEYAHELTDFLRAQGIRVWIDDDIVIGERWEWRLREKVDASSALVLIMTPLAEQSAHVERERQRARQYGIPIMPLLLSGTNHFGTAELNHEDVTTGDMPSARFVAEVRTLVEGDGRQPAVASEGVRSLRGHLGTVWSLAWSPTGFTVATASDDATVQIWEPDAATRLHTLRGHSGPVYDLAWAPDGARVATVGVDGTLRIWDAHLGALLRTLGGDHGPVSLVEWSTDGCRIATAGDDLIIRLWDVDGSGVRELAGHRRPITRLAWSTRCLATASLDGTCRIWDPRTDIRQRILAEHVGPVWWVGWTPDAARLATAGEDATVRIWDAPTGMLVRSIATHAGPVRWVEWSATGTLLATAGDDRTTQIWDHDGSIRLGTLASHVRPAARVAWAGSGNRLATVSPSRVPQVWDASTGRLLRSLVADATPAQRVAWCPKSSRMATVSDHQAHIWSNVA